GHGGAVGARGAGGGGGPGRPRPARRPAPPSAARVSQDVEARRLAGAARAHERDELAARDAEVDVVERGHGRRALAVHTGHAAERDRRRRRRALGLDCRRARAHPKGPPPVVRGRSPRTTSTITRVPGASGPASISVSSPLLRPVATDTGEGLAPLSTQTRVERPLVACCTSSGGRNRSARFGTSST